MFVKIHKSYREVIAICDSDLIGKIFEKGNFQLDVKESFFKGEKVNRGTLIEIMRTKAMEDSTFNIIGKESIETALKAGIITKESIKKIEKIPFSLVLA